MHDKYIEPLPGCRQIPTWYPSCHSVIHDFESIGRKLPLLKFIPNPFPLYDWIMGFYERWSNRRLLAMTPFETSRHILELGTGTGFLLGEVMRNTGEGQHVTAIDLSPQMLAATRHYLEQKSLISDRLYIEQADCMNMPYADQSFDLCLSSYLLDLLNEDEIIRTLAEMDRVLKPGGQALLLTMTTEFQESTLLRKIAGRLSNMLYCKGYENGRWNPIWRGLFAGYAPHCRPISLGHYLGDMLSISIFATQITHVSFLPARIYHVQKSIE